MDIPTIPGAVYTISSASSCDVTDKASGQLLGTATSGAPFTTPAYSDALTLSDPDALYVQIKTFNFALAALGLLGGGASTGSLPSGYIAAEFLESTGATSFMETDIVPHNLMGARCIVRSGLTSEGASGEYYFFSMRESSGANTRWVSLRPSVGSLSPYAAWGEAFRPSGQVAGVNDCLLNYKNSRKVGFKEKEASWLDLPELPFTPTKPLFIANRFSTAGPGHRLYFGELTEGNSVTYIFKPAISEAGEPCFYESKHKKTYKSSSPDGFIVGFSLAQARNLGKLPATGGTLTISLLTGYESDPGVAAALETARANGWTLTIQTYTPETASAGASTFALRRVWVRRTQNEQGGYVDASGSRWRVEWCVDMLTPDGSTPEAHGYELFRSTDAAVAYWELTPWVDPEAEQNELLTE